MSTKIDWCDEVWNPTTGCSKGCTYCYAWPFAERMSKNPNGKIAHAYRHGFIPICHPERLGIPMKWKRPRRIFVDSMGDLFDPLISDKFIIKVLNVMGTDNLQPCRHTFMVLTKRAARMREFFDTYSVNGALPWPNLWLGISATCQSELDALLPDLLQIKASKRFISFEPMRRYIALRSWCPACESYLIGSLSPTCATCHSRTIRPDWVICGGQTGKDAPPLYPGHVISLRDQCKAGGVPFFFKGWGEWMPIAGCYEERECPDDPGVIDGDWPLCEVDKYESEGREVIALEPGDHIPYWSKGSQYRVDHQPRLDAWYMVRLGKRRMKATIQGREWREFPA